MLLMVRTYPVYVIQSIYLMEVRCDNITRMSLECIKKAGHVRIILLQVMLYMSDRMQYLSYELLLNIHLPQRTSMIKH